MKKFFSNVAVPFVFSLLCLLLLASCSNAEAAYNKGNFQTVINRINRKQNPTADDYLLKAKSYIAMGKGNQAIESLVLYLSLAEEPSSEDRAFAVENFMAYNTSDRLSVLILDTSDGIEAQKVLYKAHVARGEMDEAKTLLVSLDASLSRSEYLDLMLGSPVDADYMLASLTGWYSSIEEAEKTAFLSYVVRFSSEITMSEAVAKQFLSLTDILMEDTYFLEDDIRLSALLKTKGNILEKLYDKVNAKIYWTQAYRLNPNDAELAKRVQ